MEWFMDHVRLGSFRVKNPYNHLEKKIDISTDSVHSIVFWSKNYDVFIRTCAGEQLTQMGYNFYFNFTINSASDLLEPNLPPLEKRLDQLDTLASLFGPEKISWRFDPICFYRVRDKGPVQNNLSDFHLIAKRAADAGIEKCVTSFFDPYPKIQKRAEVLFQKNHPSVFFTIPAMETQKKVIHRMEKHLAATKTTLSLCCEKELFSRLDADCRVLENSCIDGSGLKTLFGGLPETKRDYGQRSKQGCRCTKSIDIGSYADHPCFHNCLFCYANPDIDTTIKKSQKFNEN